MKAEEYTYWLRRIVHTFGSVSILYYLIPTQSRNFAAIAVFVIVALIEVLRVKGRINLKGLRDYERTRLSGFFYFAIGAIILLIFFPQQIAIPCILCAAFCDPLVGESRKRLGKGTAYAMMFVLSFFIFLLIWSSSTYCIAVSFMGAAAAVLGEVVKSRWIDDNVLIQLLPASIILICYFIVLHMGINILPVVVLTPP